MRYEIWGCYKGQWEEVDSTDDERDAYYLIGEYQMAFSREWKLEIRDNG